MQHRCYYTQGHYLMYPNQLNRSGHLSKHLGGFPAIWPNLVINMMSNIIFNLSFSASRFLSLSSSSLFLLHTSLFNIFCCEIKFANLQSILRNSPDFKLGFNSGILHDYTVIFWSIRFYVKLKIFLFDRFFYFLLILSKREIRTEEE